MLKIIESYKTKYYLIAKLADTFMNELYEQLLPQADFECPIQKHQIFAFVCATIYIELCYEQKKSEYKKIIKNYMNDFGDKLNEVMRDRWPDSFVSNRDYKKEIEQSFTLYLEVFKKGLYPAIQINSIFAERIYRYGYLKTQGIFQGIKNILKKEIDFFDLKEEFNNV